MGVSDASINNIMGGIENTGSVRMHNHKKKLKQRFDIIKKLGQGTYGKVQLGINKETGQEVAIKTIKKSKIQLEADLIRIRREIQIMSSVQHPNIIHIYEVFENREKMVLVMEYAAGGELYDYLSERKVLPEEEARRIFRQIAIACYYCHKHKICHRDLKLENILLDENSNAKIADFGLSNVFDDQRLLNTFCGSPLYASPEIVRGTPYHGPEVDCWSLGVLLYTLVYGAMPFDGSNFKRLVKQISQGDYFEPQKPSPASPLIREMLTVNPRNRADIEKICSHWWVNENYDTSCLDISEELANQTPVRLDLLLSLNPPPPQLESENLVVTGEAVEDIAKTEVALPTRSQSAGSLLELTHPAERRIKDMMNNNNNEEEKSSPTKRKLETTVSTDRANLSKEGLKRKDKIIKENTIADITVHSAIREDEAATLEDESMSEAPSIIKSLTQTISREMDVEPQPENAILPVDPSLQGAACAELIEDAKKNGSLSEEKVAVSQAMAPGSAAVEKSGAEASSVNKENVVQEKKAEKKEPAATPTKKKVVKKKVLSGKNDNVKPKTEGNAADAVKKAEKSEPVKKTKEPEKPKSPEKTEAAPAPASKTEETPPKQVERRRSRIFETAEKFQNLISGGGENKTPASGEKPRKIIIPGVSVDGFKKEFERKASLTSETPPPNLKNAALRKKLSIDVPKSGDEPAAPPAKEKTPEEAAKPCEVSTPAADEKVENVVEEDVARKERVRNAVNIISSALDKEGARKSKSRPCMVRKPPIPFGAGGRSASASIGMVSSSLLSPTEEKQVFKVQVGPNANDTRIATVKVSTPEHTLYDRSGQPEEAEESKTSSAEITLKSATLPRRKTTKAEIRLDYPTPKPATMEFKTEMAHHVEAPPKLGTQRSEVTFPVTSPPPMAATNRATSLEPEGKQKPKERIIQISLLDSNERKENVQSPPAKPPRPFQAQKSYHSERSDSLSRQSTQESDSETTSSREPIRKSPREYIIPIAVEGGGYVTPRAGSLEPSETASSASTMTNASRRSKLSKLGRRFDSMFDRDGSEDESPFTSLHRHSSFGRESDTEDSKKDTFHMHRLRSSRPRKSNLEHNDSLSSGEDDDDDGFEILTAENLFSTLLSRVRDLTQRLNVEDGGRPGFPSSRLLSHFDHGANFWNVHNRLDPLSRPFGRTFSQESSSTRNSNSQFGVPWRRSVSKDLASDIESIFKNPTPTHTASLPRGDRRSSKNDDDLNLSDLDLKKLRLSDEDALALSYLTPGLSRRIQRQLLSQLPPSEARKLSRTLSMQNRNENRVGDEAVPSGRRSVERTSSSTLPRRCVVAASPLNRKSEEPLINRAPKSFLPVKPAQKRDECLLDGRSGAQLDDFGYYKKYEQNHDAGDGVLHRKPKASRSLSLRERKLEPYSSSVYSPDSSISDSSYKNTDSDVSSSKIYGQDYSPETSALSKYLSYDSPDSGKNDAKRPYTASRKISRFLRPDFYDVPKEESVYLKEKKEREMETQKVLKEIRDKRIKNRINLRRERSLSKDRQQADVAKEKSPSCRENNVSPAAIPSTEALLQTVSDNIKKLESNVKTAIPSYVNVPAENNETNPAVVVVKKERASKIARPKSYPVETCLKESSPKIEPPAPAPPEKEAKSKIGRLKKTKPTKTDAAPPEADKEKTKNKFLQTLERKIEKLRSLSNTPTESTDDGKSSEKQGTKSCVENAIKKLREQSLPRNLEHCTESGLIKRAVSVEDLPNGGSCSKLQTSRKSVSKILGLFKKYEDKGEKEKKSKKSKEAAGSGGADAKSGETAPVANDQQAKRKTLQKAVSLDESERKAERPKSLFFDRVRQFNGTKSTNDDGNAKPKASKLPVNSFSRRSLNLENVNAPAAVVEPCLEIKTPDRPSAAEPSSTETKKPDRRSLKLDLNKPMTRHKQPLIYIEPTPSTSSSTPRDFKEGINSAVVANQDSSVFLSPCDDNDASCDSWSICSDFCSNELSPLSPNGHGIYSGDENESVIDRIRRKSFYSRFNEKKRPRKLAGSYKDLDLYKEAASSRKPSSTTSGYKLGGDYSALNSRLDYRSPLGRYSVQDPVGRKCYGMSPSSTLFTHDGYVNVPNRYQTYNPRYARHVVPYLYSDFEDGSGLHDVASGRTRKYISQPRHSSHGRSISPMSEQSYDEAPHVSPYVSNSPTSHSPL